VTTHPPAPVPPVLTLLIALVAMSTSGPVIRLAATEPLAVATWRLEMTLVVVLVAVTLTRGWGQLRRLSAGAVALGSLAGVFLALHFWTWMTSLDLTTVAASTVLVSVQPVFVAVGSAVLLAEVPVCFVAYDLLESDAIDRRHDGLRAGAHGLDQVARHAREHQQLGCLQLHQRTDDLVDIATGAEIASGPGHDHGLDFRGVGQRPKEVTKLGIGFECQRVLPLRAVERDRCDFPIHFPLEVVGLIVVWVDSARAKGVGGDVHRVVRGVSRALSGRLSAVGPVWPQTASRSPTIASWSATNS
jgi:hypothetical protein